jgi:thioester reductase-like protein
MQALQAYQIQEIPADRIVAIPADLSLERFGLGPAAFTELAVGVRAVYHCAAEVNFIVPYERLSVTNVGGTREMIRFAAAGGAVLHHVSSVAVFPYGGNRVRYEDEDIAGVDSLTGGYAQSKWVAERMVWKSVVRGLRAVVYRPAQIVTPGTGQLPHDLFGHVMRACRTLRAVPNLEAKIDLVPVKFAAAAICALSFQESSIGRAFHLVHPAPLGLRKFVELFSEPLPLIPLEDWLALLSQESEQREDASLQLVSMLAQGLARADLTPPDFDCSATNAGLNKTKIVCPPLDQQFIKHELALP